MVKQKDGQRVTAIRSRRTCRFAPVWPLSYFTFVLNHLAPFLLTRLLLDRVAAARRFIGMYGRGLARWLADG